MIVNMVNQTLLPIDKGYPERLILPDSQTSWDYELPQYMPPLHPHLELAQERLAAAGVVVESMNDFDRLATLNNRQAAEEFGEAIIKLRNPLGRTGINGSGLYYVAGESATADMAVMRFDLEPEIALVYNRNKWSLPGGFCDNEQERENRRIPAVRELWEEAHIDVTELAALGLVETLLPKHVKQNSRRATDMGFLTNQVEVTLLPDPEMGDAIHPGDDAEKAQWVSFGRALILKDQKMISVDHFNYVFAAFQWLETKEPSAFLDW